MIPVLFDSITLDLFTWMDYLKFSVQFPFQDCYILNYYMKKI